jgi:hypothetical protein
MGAFAVLSINLELALLLTSGPVSTVIDFTSTGTWNQQSSINYNRLYPLDPVFSAYGLTKHRCFCFVICLKEKEEISFNF